MARLDSIPQMLLPVMFTLSRGNPPVKELFQLETTFEDVVIDAANVKEYSAFCGFQNSADFPATWLYTLAQRAQIALMLDKRFPLAAPGMVHITNDLEMFQKPDVALPLTIQATATIPSKTGSLFPHFQVEMMQSGTRIAHIKSGYIAKRGGGEKTSGGGANSASAKAEETPATPDFSLAKDGGQIIMPDSIGWDYAKVSGDFNPIHIAGFMAKAFGLPGKLVHGWYSVSMFASIIERIKNTQVNKISVQFAKPVLIPTTVNIEYIDLHPTQTAFRITSANKKGTTTVHLTGTVG